MCGPSSLEVFVARLKASFPLIAPKAFISDLDLIDTTKPIHQFLSAHQFSPNKQNLKHPNPHTQSPDPPMKRPLADGDPTSIAVGDTDSAAAGDKDVNKKIKQEGKEDEPEEMSKEAEAVLLDDNLLYEVLRHVDDGRTLAKAACVSRQWKRTAHDERIWELICTRHYHRSPMQLRPVVLALGGFRSLYSSHLWPLLKPASSSSSAPPAVSTWPCLPPAPAPPPGAARSKARWGKDEVNLSLSLLSIKYFEKMSSNNRSK